MLQKIEVTGKTESEAISKALEQLQLDRDEVSVEILERAKSGFLGIGGTLAKICVTYDDGQQEPLPQEEAAPAAAVQPEEKPAEKRIFAEEKLSGRKTAPGRSQERDSRQETRPPKARAEAHKEEKKPAFVPEDLGEEAQDEKAGQIRTFLQGLLEHMDSAAAVKVYAVEDDRYKVILEGDKLGQLIGRRGETLDAVQQLANYAVNRDTDKRVRVQVDAENYRAKREESLNRLAEKVAGKVLKYRRNVTLEPMNAYERHVIHTALQDYENVSTYSIGTEPNRRVVVAYDRSKGRQ